MNLLDKLKISQSKLLSLSNLKQLKGGDQLSGLCCYFYSDYQGTLILCGHTPSCGDCESVKPPETVFSSCNDCATCDYYYG